MRRKRTPGRAPRRGRLGSVAEPPRVRACGRVSLLGGPGRQSRAGPGPFPPRRACPWPRRVTQPEHVVGGRASAAPASRERAFQSRGDGRRRERQRQQRRPRGRRGAGGPVVCGGRGPRGRRDGGECGGRAGREMDARLAPGLLHLGVFPPCSQPRRVAGAPRKHMRLITVAEGTAAPQR